MSSEASRSLLSEAQGKKLSQTSPSNRALPANDSVNLENRLHEPSVGAVQYHGDISYACLSQRHASFDGSNARASAGELDVRGALEEPPISTGRDDKQLRERSLTERWFRDWWALEIMSIVCSVLSFAAMIGVLGSYSGLPLDAWSAPVKINTAISLFSTLSKSSLLLTVASCIGQLKWQYFARQSRKLTDLQCLDEASRGPLGACDLLCRSKGRSILAVFAASAVILALAVDPLAQQVLSFPSGEVRTANESATILRAQSYDTGKAATIGGATSVYAPLKLQGAIYRGIFNLRSENMFFCPTGDCDYPTFANLEVCSSCSDITNESRRECWTTNGTGPIPASKDLVDNLLYCEYTLPRDANLWTRAKQSFQGPFNTLVNSTGRAVFGQGGPTTIAHTMTVRLPEEYTLHHLPFGEVHECELYLCVKKYANVKVRQGILDDSDVVRYDLANAGYWIYPGSPYNATIEQAFSIIKEPDNYDLNRTFTFNFGDRASIAWFLTDLFTVARWSRAAYYNDPMQPVNIGYALQKAADISKLYENIAKSMSEHLRSGPNTTTTYGVTISTAPFIHVRWAWLILPGTLIICGLALLIALILSTKRRNIALWKSSSLALLFHGLPEDQLTGHSRSPATIQSVSDMDNVADALTVRLCNVDDTARLLLSQPDKEAEVSR